MTMLIIGGVVVLIVAGIVFGALFARKNSKTVNAVVDAVKTIEEQTKK